jgi:ribosomal protein L6P/L9E
MSDESNFVKVLIARGIGYRIFALSNDFAGRLDIKPGFKEKARLIYSESREVDAITKMNNTVVDLPYSLYLLVRAGHTNDLILPLSAGTMALTSKKDRKLAVLGRNSTAVANTAKRIFSYRPPSAYTGRGIRVKHAKPIRKAGKKDKQKGKAF